MTIVPQDLCGLCGASQQERPLVHTSFRGEDIPICITCMPTACRGMNFEALAENLREKRSQALNEQPLAKPGLRY